MQFYLNEILFKYKFMKYNFTKFNFMKFNFMRFVKTPEYKLCNKILELKWNLLEFNSCKMKCFQGIKNTFILFGFKVILFLSFYQIIIIYLNFISLFKSLEFIINNKIVAFMKTHTTKTCHLRSASSLNSCVLWMKIFFKSHIFKIFQFDDYHF